MRRRRAEGSLQKSWRHIRDMRKKELDAKPMDKVKEPKERRKGRELER